jgi:uncharacterized protein (UPF0262 family)
MDETRQRLAGIELDEQSIVRWHDDVAHERSVAICDLLESNSFVLTAYPEAGPYFLHLSLRDNRLVFLLRDLGGHELGEVLLPLSPFRNVVREYFAVCDAYYRAVRGAQAQQIETIDIGRRGLHNEAASLLKERLNGQIGLDDETARRLFTLLCVLHLKERGA